MRGNLTARNVSMIQKFSGVAGRAKWCAWPGGGGGGDEGAASRAAKLLFGIKMSFCGLNILKLLS